MAFVKNRSVGKKKFHYKESNIEDINVGSEDYFSLYSKQLQNCPAQS
jgi:hypothetical protein